MRPKLLFLASEDYFVRSHFMGFLARAQAEGYDTVVAARGDGARADLEAAGARTIALDIPRGGIGPAAIWRSVRAVRAVLARERPALVHAMSLKIILLLLLAGVQRGSACVLAVTGQGFFGATRSVPHRLAAAALRRAIAARVRRARAVLFVENASDRDWIAAGTPLPAAAWVIAPGAGVDPVRYPARPEPPAPPLRVGVIARLIRSKGVDLAVGAIQQLRARGLAIELIIGGEPDPENPACVNAEELARWRAGGGVTLCGRVTDVPAFWAQTHVACIPSRGGEGLPRTILEAGASARAIVTTDTPGCRDFVLAGETGLVVPPGDVGALADALRTLAEDPALRARFAAAARARLVSQFTEAHAADAAALAWARARDQAGS